MNLIRRRRYPLPWLLSAIYALSPLAAGAQALGPVDGMGLPRADTGRVAVGMMAPDFTLQAFKKSPLTLSGFRGKKNVILAFYRGHW